MSADEIEQRVRTLENYPEMIEGAREWMFARADEYAARGGFDAGAHARMWRQRAHEETYCQLRALTWFVEHMSMQVNLATDVNPERREMVTPDQLARIG